MRDPTRIDSVTPHAYIVVHEQAVAFEAQVGHHGLNRRQLDRLDVPHDRGSEDDCPPQSHRGSRRSAPPLPRRPGPRALDHQHTGGRSLVLLLLEAEERPAHLKDKPGFGSIWTWTALDADSKLMISWVVSDRSQEAADAIMADLKSRIMNRIQLNSDGLPSYVEAVVKVFRPGAVDHAEIVKKFANSKPSKDLSPNSAASRYSPGRMLSVEKRVAFGEPDAERASTSYMERWNLTLRMANRRFTRLTNAFSKKLTNHAYMLAIHDGLLQLLPEARVPQRSDSGDGRGHHVVRMDRE